MFPIRSHTNNVYPYFTCLLSTTDWYFLLYPLLLNVCTGTTTFPQLSSQCPILEKPKLCFLKISTAGSNCLKFSWFIFLSPDFMNLFLVTWETFVLNLHISHLLILYVVTFSVIVLFLMPTSSSPSWLQFGNSGILACTLLCNNSHIHVNCDSVFIYLNNILIWLCGF